MYVDRDSIYRSDRLPTAAEALSGSGPLAESNGRVLFRV